MPAAFIKEAFCKLETHDLVLGPSRDGGFYLIGMKKPEQRVFSHVRWSSDKAARQTLYNAKKLKIKVALLKKWYDIDDLSSLFFLKTDLENKKNSAFWTKKMLKKI